MYVCVWHAMNLFVLVLGIYGDGSCMNARVGTTTGSLNAGFAVAGVAVAGAAIAGVVNGVASSEVGFVVFAVATSCENDAFNTIAFYV